MSAFCGSLLRLMTMSLRHYPQQLHLFARPAAGWQRTDDQLPIISDIQQTFGDSVEWFDAAGCWLLRRASRSITIPTTTGGERPLIWRIRRCVSRWGWSRSRPRADAAGGGRLYGSYFSKCKMAGTEPDTLTFYDLPFALASRWMELKKTGGMTLPSWTSGTNTVLFCTVTAD